MTGGKVGENRPQGTTRSSASFKEGSKIRSLQRTKSSRHTHLGAQTLRPCITGLFMA